jgi:CheY-like chemotaxis protein
MATIQVVDDRGDDRQLLATLIDYYGHHVIEGTDGAEALQIGQAERPDLIISDILMPTMNGYEFVRRLRADPDIAKTAVVFYTANYLEREALAMAQACVVSQILSKPCEPAEVMRTVEGVLHLTTPIAPTHLMHGAHRDDAQDPTMQPCSCRRASPHWKSLSCAYSPSSSFSKSCAWCAIHSVSRTAFAMRHAS